MVFNPFDKEIDELEPADLQKLIERSVAEGYYVEYKGDVFPSNTKIGHSIASFANSYGGWYIIGVQTNPHNVAKEICGFDLSTYPDPISKFRDIAKSHIDPTPIFFLKVVEFSGKAVLVVHIPAEQEMPFITRDGRIYRRVHDSSDPVSESNRSAIDRLIDEGRRANKRFARFSRDDRILSKKEADGISWVNFYVQPYPSGIVPDRDVTSRKALREVLTLSQSPFSAPLSGFTDFRANLPFNSAQPTVNSVLLQQIKPSNLPFNSLSVELFSDGALKALIPLEFIPEISQRHIIALQSEKAQATLRKLFDEDPGRNTKFLKFFEAGKLWLTVIIILSFYRHWLGETSAISHVKAAIEIKNAWRAVPFYDHDSWAEHADEFGVPVIKSDDRRFPRDPERGIVLDYGQSEFIGEDLGSVLCEAFGLPAELYGQSLQSQILKSSGLVKEA